MRKILAILLMFLMAGSTYAAGTRTETENFIYQGSNIYSGPVVISNTPFIKGAQTFTIWTNTGTTVMSAINTQLVSITGMNGNGWSFEKPAIWSTNISFSATAKVSFFTKTPLAGCNEVWRNSSVAIGSVYNSVEIGLATNIIYVIDATPFTTLATPFQAIIIDGTSNECVTVTNVVSTNLYCAFNTQYSHAISNVVSHYCTLNIPGWINSEIEDNTLLMYLEFSAAQTVGIKYQIPYIRVK